MRTCDLEQFNSKSESKCAKTETMSDRFANSDEKPNESQSQHRVISIRQPRDFSIAAILADSSKTTNSKHLENHSGFPEDFNGEAEQSLEWLHYTRYTPPKLPRIKRKDCLRKRRLGRNPRVPFSNVQVALLETRFRMTQYVSGSDVMEIALALGLTENRVKIWFQNRRARERREKIASFCNPTNFIPVTSPSVGANQHFYLGPQIPMKAVPLTPSEASAFHSVPSSAVHCSSIFAVR